MAMDYFLSGNYCLVYLDNTTHASRVNGLHLKKYCAWLINVVKDGLEDIEERINASSFDNKVNLNSLILVNPKWSRKWGFGQTMLGSSLL